MSLIILSIGICIGFILGWIVHKYEYGEAITDENIFNQNKTL